MKPNAQVLMPIDKIDELLARLVQLDTGYKAWPPASAGMATQAAMPNTQVIAEQRSYPATA